MDRLSLISSWSKNQFLKAIEELVSSKFLEVLSSYSFSGKDYLLFNEKDLLKITFEKINLDEGYLDRCLRYERSGYLKQLYYDDRKKLWEFIQDVTCPHLELIELEKLIGNEDEYDFIFNLFQADYLFTSFILRKGSEDLFRVNLFREHIEICYLEDRNEGEGQSWSGPVLLSLNETDQVLLVLHANQELDSNHLFSSGKKILRTSLALSYLFGLRRMILNDCAKVGSCEINYSFIRLAAKGKSFYEQFGFKVIPDHEKDYNKIKDSLSEIVEEQDLRQAIEKMINDDPIEINLKLKNFQRFQSKTWEQILFTKEIVKKDYLWLRRILSKTNSSLEEEDD